MNAKLNQIGGSSPGPPTKILVVEDEAGARDLLTTILQSEGYEVLAVEDGETCLTLYSQFQPDLVLLDVMLPGMGGFECCRELRAHSEHPLQIVMLTSLDQEEAVQAAIAAGASDYLTKPIRPAVLQQQIRRFIQHQTTQHQLQDAQTALQPHLQQRSLQLEQALEKLSQVTSQVNEFEQLKTNLITYLSRNIRSPLGIILNSSELLQCLATQPGDRQNEYLKRIEAGVETILRVLELLTTFEHLTSGGYQVHPTGVNLPQLCQTVIEEWQSTLTSQYSLALVQYGVPKLEIRLDLSLIRQTLNQLISNAVRYSPKGGNICVHLHWLPDSIILEVEDEGLGIPDADQPKIFNPFYRASNANDVPGTPGVGVGLAVVKQAVELQGGTITVSTRIGSGTTFRVALPTTACS